MAIASAVFKKLAVKKQSGLGTKAAAGASGSAQYLRRVSADLSLKKANYESNEIRPSMMTGDMRHGVKSVSGTLNGELSCGTYQGFEESLLRAAASTAITTGALTDVTAAVTTGASGTLTRTTGSYLTDGLKVGMVVRCSGWTAPATGNNAHNILITGLTALILTGRMLNGTPFVAKVSGDSVTIAEVGKHIVIPLTGHTRDYWTIEQWHADIAQSHTYLDCVIAKKSVQLPATGIGTLSYDVMGLNMDTATSEYFTSPASATTTGTLAAVNGILLVAGTPVALLTSMNFDIDGQYAAPGGVVGSNVDPDIFPGMIKISGSTEVLFQDAVLRDNFINEDEVSIVAVFTASNAANADFQTHVFPRVKINSFDVNDDPQKMSATVSFAALENGVSSGTFPTAYFTQDSQFV